MKIELREEIEYDRPTPWVSIYIDDVWKYGSFDKVKMEWLYEETKTNPIMFNKVENVLKSEEINE